MGIGLAHDVGTERWSTYDAGTGIVLAYDADAIRMNRARHTALSLLLHVDEELLG